MKIQPTWSNEEASIKQGKENCVKGLATSDDVNYQTTGWPDGYPETMTPELYQKFYLSDPYYQSIPIWTESSIQAEGPLYNINKLNVFCMTWNTESLNICAFKDGKWYGGKNPPLYLTADKCYQGIELVERLKSIIRQNEGQLDILVFAFQESAKPGDYFFSFSLPEFMKNENYVLLTRERAIGVGLTTFTKQKLRGLRLAIFLKRDLYENLPIKIISSSFKACGGEYTKDWVRGKGGLQITLDIEGFGKYMFINYHLPFSASRLNPENPKLNELLLFQTDCFTSTYKQFIKEIKPDYVFVMGDLNYRIQGLREDEMFDGDDKIRKDQFNRWYQDYDELHKLIDKISHVGDIDEEWEVVGSNRSQVSFADERTSLKEGLNNKGPMFAPTCKMMKGRAYNCTDRMCYQVTHSDGNYRVPSWCDRILYSHRNLSKPDITPITYNRMDDGDMMTCSDHAGVYGIFTISK